MRFTDFTLERLAVSFQPRSVWFSAIDGRGCLAHMVARDLIRRAMTNKKQDFENLLRIIRRYE